MQNNIDFMYLLHIFIHERSIINKSSIYSGPNSMFKMKFYIYIRIFILKQQLYIKKLKKLALFCCICQKMWYNIDVKEILHMCDFGCQHIKERKMIIMMMIPRRSNFDIFDDMFQDSFFRDEKSRFMKTDIKEKEDGYLISIDLPGYEKENISVDVENGYLNIQAKTDSSREENEEGKFVRKERYVGECSRSFYVGEEIESEDVRATFRNGTLHLEVPKKEKKQELPEKKYVQIEDK